MASPSSSRERSFSDFQRETPAASRKIYDAFLNHRGPDVKETLAFALYDSLEEEGFKTFLDDMEIELGDPIPSAIQDAIYSSKVQIAIFSPRYAESSWCLDELVLMLETKARFIPIFCDVKPFELRYPDKGVYAAAFAKHEEKGRFSEERRDQWKEALHSSSLISGYEFTTSKGEQSLDQCKAALHSSPPISGGEISTSNEIVNNIESLRTRIALAVQQEVGKKNVFPRHGQVGLHADTAASTSTLAHVKRSSLLPRDSHAVGIDSKVEDIKRLLENPQVQVIVVVGMGGLGKTFLLQNVYKALKSEYDHSIWLSISKTYSVKDLQHDIASDISLTKEIVEAKVTEEKAAELIHDRLQGKRSLIVLDDLWELSREGILFDKLGLPNEDCKIVVTTRNRQVALNSNAEIYEMEHLSDEYSWGLFCFYAFPKGNIAPQHIEEEGRKIVKQCGNLPLAIKTIAASLANTTLSKWELKRRQLERVCTSIGNPDPVMEILKLSYDSLPAHLKKCFAYLSFFPEDEKIKPEYLINLWIGEGFIPAGEDQWDIAWDWFDQLAQLCLLQICEEYYHDDFMINTYCKIHDLLHDLAIQIAKEDKCVFSAEEVSMPTSGATGWGRILLAKKGLHGLAISDSRPVYIRTLSLSHNPKIRRIPESLFIRMRGIRVLDLRCTMISRLPASLGKIVLLRVLNLDKTEIKEVPECVRHLKSLLFLALPSSCDSLPSWIGELTCLQNLEWCRGGRMPKGITKLASLRTLTSGFMSFSAKEDDFVRLEDMVNMAQLEEMHFSLEQEMDCDRMEEGILAQLVNMRRLEIESYKETRFLQFSKEMRAMKHLEKLSLSGFNVPSWIHKLENLRELHLNFFECSDFPEFQEMPNLVVLIMGYNESCRELPKAFGKSGGFPQLRILHLDGLVSLEEIPELEDGAMPCLQEFRIYQCGGINDSPKLKKVEGLERLKRLKIFYCRKSTLHESWESLEEGGEYWNKIKVINPRVHIEFSDCKIGKGGQNSGQVFFNPKSRFGKVESELSKVEKGLYRK
ncbi:hypothetical protein SUGI_1120070 [Cryptomeria japonica]|nr:hypothetical protein SUGI_1120070 [Cryptomeria japonica]